MADDLPLLDLAGFEESTERAYVHVLMHGRATAHEVAEQLQADDETAFRRLEDLRGLGLVSRLEGESPTYAAVDPRYALRTVVDRLSDQALRIREAIPSLGEYFDAGTPEDPASQQTVVLSDPDTVAAWYARLEHQATKEFLAFDRPPYVSASFDPFQAAVLARGVDWRSIYTIESFDEGSTWEEVELLAEQGEQSRITDELPLKLVIVDGSTALVSLSLDPGRIEALITHAPPLVAALHELFEFHWARAVPLPGAREQVAGTTSAAPLATAAGRPPTPEERAILTLMAVGMKDDAIARRLGVSARTLRRRSQELLAELGAGNRFQAGVEAARRGWL
ncbi:LuxR family transcriptional regulator [Agromyces protaetiae]|uniref:LuxR family transcriptional regulator n=1 Tax=Agromyces protaetiae TaxID=2509455 RepID=A0A4P6FQ90_9MICO|nr:helix-turn-helix domain-containing protein [Agromyces protaetiae]QAY72698.1 LuxR family transcriptional regulator [Agromyces protaetiae]